MTQQVQQPIAGRATQVYECATCKRTFTWNVQPTMPPHIAPQTGTWCLASGVNLKGPTA